MPATKSTQKKDTVTTAPDTTQTMSETSKKTSKSSKSATSATTATTAVVAPVVETVKKATKSRTKKEETSAATSTTTTETPEVANVVVVSDETSITDNFSEFIVKFQTMISSFSALKAELKVLERRTVKSLKVVQKINNKKKRKGTRAPSGFVKPSLISNELAHFLGKPEGSEMARTDVTREINKYIRANSLQDKDNGRKINPDKLLCDLLKIPSDINLTYFNLQRYMGPHFPKQSKSTMDDSVPPNTVS